MKMSASEQGSTLLTVLMFGSALLVLGGFILSLALVENRIAHNHEKNSVLYYITEAGLEKGLAVLREDFFFSGEIEGKLGEGSYRVDIKEHSPGTRKIVSEGKLPPGKKELKLLVEASPFYLQALAAGQRLEVNDVEVKGRAHYNHKLVAGPGENVVKGKLTCPDGAQLQKNGGGQLTVEEEVYGVEKLNFPAVKVEELKSGDFLELPPGEDKVVFKEAPEEEKIMVKGNLEINPGEDFAWEGTLLAEGDIVVYPDEGLELEGTLAAGGNIEIFSGGKLNREGKVEALRLVAGGDLSVDSSGAGKKGSLFNGRLLLYAQGDLQVEGHGEPLKVRGSVMAGGSLQAQNTKFVYDPGAWNREAEIIWGNRVVIKEWLQS